MPPDFSLLFDRPLIIMAAPRSGSTLLFETLSEVYDVWTIGSESHGVIEGIRELNPNSGHVDSNRLTAMHANGQVTRLIRRRFARFLKDRDGREFVRNQQIKSLRFLEKTPKNSLRIPFLDAIFPDALYVYLHRQIRPNISSMMEAWRSGKWVTYPRLSGWQGPPWSLLLPPGWKTVNGHSLAEICAFQWASANRFILDDLGQISKDRWMAVSYEELLENSESVISTICQFAGLTVDTRLTQRLNKPLPFSRLTQTRPSADKWRKNEAEIVSVLESVNEVEQRMSVYGYSLQE